MFTTAKWSQPPYCRGIRRQKFSIFILQVFRIRGKKLILSILRLYGLTPPSSLLIDIPRFDPSCGFVKMTPEFKNMEDLLAQLLVPDTDSIERVSSAI